jgi:hypothetical protein
MRQLCLASILVANVALAMLPALADAKPSAICKTRDSDDVCAGPITLDFDGDGHADSVILVGDPGPIGVTRRVTVISGLWGSEVKDAKGAALLVSLGNSKRAFLLMDRSGFFDTPIWKLKPLPLGVAKRGSKSFKEFQAQDKRIQHDVLVLGTEAGIDTALYWNGKTFALFEPIEEP